MKDEEKQKKERKEGWREGRKGEGRENGKAMRKT